jgi:hypothetical protein
MLCIDMARSSCIEIPDAATLASEARNHENHAEAHAEQSAGSCRLKRIRLSPAVAGAGMLTNVSMRPIDKDGLV